MSAPCQSRAERRLSINDAATETAGGFEADALRAAHCANQRAALPDTASGKPEDSSRHRKNHNVKKLATYSVG
jgi:hypothetical protein